MTIAILLVTVHLANHARLPRDFVQAVAREAAAVWTAAGTELAWAISLQSDAMLRVRPDLNVVLARRCLKTEATNRRVPVASIQFFEGRPTSRVCVSLAAANALLDHEPTLEPRLRHWALRRRMLARMIGRAIAHEIGHYLFASVDHTPQGLMRARHTVNDLVGDSLAPFSVDADDCTLNVQMFDVEKER
jgi:hypothetical protein